MKTQSGRLLQQLGVSSDTIMHPELLKLVLYQQTWDEAFVPAELVDTAARMVIVSPFAVQGKQPH